MGWRLGSWGPGAGGWDWELGLGRRAGGWERSGMAGAATWVGPGIGLIQSGAIWIDLERSGAIWSELEQSGLIWSDLKRPGSIWSDLEQSGAIGNDQERS